MGILAPDKTPTDQEAWRIFTSPGTASEEDTKGDPFWDIALPLHDVFTPPTITAPDLTEQEKRIIAQMKEIAMGDPELSQLYVQNIQKAFQGTDIPLGLQKDIEEMQLQSQEAIARRLGAVGDIRSTPGLKSAEKTRRQALGLRESARQEAIRQAEGLMTSQQARQIGAAQVALSPLTHSGSLQSRAAQQSALNQAQQQAGMMNLAGTIIGSYGGRRQTGLTNTGTTYSDTDSSPQLYDYYSQGTGSF